MWHSRFLGTIFSVLALLGFMESQTALAAYPTSPGFSKSQETRGIDGSFQLAIMGGSSAIPLGIPSEPAEKAQSEKPAVKKPKATSKASKPKKKRVKKAKKAPAKKPVEEEEGFFSKTFKSLVGDDDEKEAAPKSRLQKTAEKKPETEEEGLLTRTLKKLVGGDQNKEKKAAKKNVLSPLNTAPTGSSATRKKVEEQPKTAKSETKKTLKDSFEKLIGVGAVSDDGKSQSAKADKTTGEIKSAKKEKSGGLLGDLLGGSDKKKDSSATKQAKAQATVEKASAPAKPRKLTAKKYVEEEAQEEAKEEGREKKNYAGAKKGKNVLKESFKTLLKEEK